MASLALAIFVAVRIPGLFSPVFTDEVHILEAVSHYLGNRTLIPPWFDWPPLFSWFAIPFTGAVATAGGTLLGIPATEWAILHSAFPDFPIVLGIRLCSLIMSVCAAIFLWKLLPHASNSARIAGLAVMAFSPVAVRYGSWGLPESGVVLCVAAALYCAIRLQAKSPRKDLILCAMATGAAAAFKYNGGLVAASAIVGLITTGNTDVRRTLKNLCLFAGSTLLCFLLLTPTWLVVPRSALGGLLFETNHVSTPRLGEQYNGYFDTVRFLLKKETGWVLGFLAGIVVFRRNMRLAGILLSLLLLNFLVVGRWARMDANYWIPSLPAAVGGLVLFTNMLPNKVRSMAAAMICGILVLQLFRTAPPPLSPDARHIVSLHLRKWPAGTLRVVRDGAYTPKIWDHKSIDAFMQGRGSKLGARSRGIFQQKLAESPQAAEVVNTSEWLYDDESTRTLNGYNMFITTRYDTDPVMRYPRSNQPKLRRIYDKKRAMYDEVFRSEKWDLVFSAQSGFTGEILVFRRKTK